MNSTYLTTALVIAMIEMKKEPIPKLGLKSIYIESDRTSRGYFFDKTVETMSGELVKSNGMLPIELVDNAFNEIKNKRVKEFVAEKIIEITTQENHLKTVSGSYVTVFNVRELKNQWACTVVIGNTEKKTKERRDNVKFPKQIIRLGQVK